MTAAVGLHEDVHKYAIDCKCRDTNSYQRHGITQGNMEGPNPSQLVRETRYVPYFVRIGAMIAPIRDNC